MRLLAELRGRRILILGFGREGRSTLGFLQARLPDASLGVADRRTLAQMSADERAALAALPADRVRLGPDYLDLIPQFDVIVRSPGLAPDAPPLQQARDLGKRVTSLVNLFFDVAPGRIVGVTGTKGKSTTTNAIHRVLSDAGLDARLGGNIGIPLLSCLDGANEDTVFVVELSSFQLSDLEYSPHIAVVQNVVREHLDYHGTFEKYVAAKANIAAHQSSRDTIVYNGDHEIPTVIAAHSPGTRLAFGLEQRPGAVCYVEDGRLVHATDGAETPIIRIDEIPLPGAHNTINMMPSIVVGRLFGIEPATIATSIRSLSALPHRMQLVHAWHGRQFYNDSLSTVPEAAMAALAALKDRPTVLLAGGHDRGQTWSELAAAIIRANITAVVMLPRGDRELFAAIERAAGEAGTPAPTLLAADSMPEAVRCAIDASAPGSAILLSPAAASFGAFRDYEDRGNQFRESAVAQTAASDSPPHSESRAPTP